MPNVYISHIYKAEYNQGYKVASRRELIYGGNPTILMGTLALEKLTRENLCLSALHWFPGPVEMPGLARARKFGIGGEGAMTQDESGQRGLFRATSDRYAAGGSSGSLVSVPEGLDMAARSGGGSCLVDLLAESIDNDKVLAGMKEKKVDEKVWSLTQGIFACCTGCKQLLSV